MSPPPRPTPRPLERRAVIATAWIHDDDLYEFNRLRERFFPRVRTFASAHVTLFHHLPGVKRATVLAGIREEVAAFAHPDLDPATGLARVASTGVFRMGRGTAYRLERDFLTALRAPLRARFAADLRPQDAAPWRNPHITVMNKVAPERAARLTRHLAARFEPCELRVLGVQAWRYDYGPWALLGEFAFARSLAPEAE